MVTEMTRPIIGIENRTAQEVFDIMCDRFKAEFGNEEAPRYTTRRLREEIRKAEERGRQHEREAALSTDAEPVALQDRVQPWMMACFGEEISGDKLERGDRLLEEVLELLQSGDYPRERIRALEEYTFSRDKGEPSQEVGGVMITLAAYCLAHGLNMHEAGETELARIWTKVEKIRAKQAAKPTGSALPVAAALSAQVQDVAGLSVWKGWDKSRDFWSETKHRDEVMYAMFRGPWSMEDAAMLLGFIDRTWPKAPAAKLEEKP